MPVAPLMHRLAVVTRGAAAVRLVHAAREYALLAGRPLRVIAVHLETERDALFVREADAGASLGDRGYLDIDAVLDVLRRSEADTAWVGWGALAQSADFAEACERAGVRVVGPDAATLRRLADRGVMAELAEAAGVPLVPLEVVERGYARHLEVQVVGDRLQTVWALGVHDGTLQRRTEKVLVESATPGLTGIDDRALLASATKVATLAGLSGAGTVTFVQREDVPGVGLLRVSAGLPLGHGITELTTGLDLATLQLHLADGGRLDGQPPLAEGHAIGVRLSAEDASQGFSPTPGTITVLQLPAGPGLRIDTAVEEGDVIQPGTDSVVAEVVAWGRDREEARVRLCRALVRFPVVLDGGTTNKGFLLDLLERPELKSGRYDTAWLDRLAGTGVSIGHRYGDLAILMAGIDAHDTAQAIDRDRLFTSARRGRPEVRTEVGHTVQLCHDANEYKLWVRRYGRRRYRIDVSGPDDDAVTVDAVVTRLGRHQSRIEVDGVAARVVSDTQGGDHLVEVEGVPHRLSRSDGGIVRAPVPGVVVDVRAVVGERVDAGDPIVIVESMKMEQAVVAPFGARVREVLVGPNVQVAPGSPLVQLDPPSWVLEGRRGPRVRFEPVPLPPPAPAERAGLLLETLRRLTMGYAVDPVEADRLVGELDQVAAELAPDDPRLVGGEARLLEVFADVQGLFRSQRELDDADLQVHSPREHLYAYLRSLGTEGRDLPERFLAQLRRALRHYGVDSLAPTLALEDALYWIVSAKVGDQIQVPAVVAVLQRWLHADIGGALDDPPATRALLERLAAAAARTSPVVADLARDVRYRLFDEPVVATTRVRVLAEMSAHLEALLDGEIEPGRAPRIAALVDCHQSLAPMLVQRLVPADAAASRIVLEVLARRYYRWSDPREMATAPGPVPGLICTVDEAGEPTQLVVVAVAPDRLATAADGIDPLLVRPVDGRPVAVEVVTWSRTPDDGDAVVDRAAAVVAELARHHPVVHAVATIGRAGADGRIASVEHVTYRTTAGGAIEPDRSLHGLHPMMARRLRLWRLDLFETERLPSPDDVYLFRGVARSNPQDERLFAIAEVRDLLPIHDPSGTVVVLPEVERVLASALESIRRYQAPREPMSRLPWNRISLHVWPILDLGLDDVRRVAQRLAPATVGLGIEDIVVSCRRPDPETGEIRDRVLHLSNPAGTGFVLSEADPPTLPLQPLDEYTQKVVQSRRRGTIYPYELVRSLVAPGAGGRDVLGGEFVEYDLDGDRLVPAARPAGRNSASIVVGVVRNRTARYPEGMARVVLLGDPTRALGALAEAECRRVIAALDLAEELDVPVDWFALSAGARIAMDSGTENMDWIADVLRRIIEHTQAGREINVVVTGINVGAQPYWNAEATMLMHTKGILVMTPDSTMVLTGKQALDFSGSVSAEDNEGIGGYARIMGPNGQAQYWASDLDEAIGILLAHHEHSYVAPGERFPRRAGTADPIDRDVRGAPHVLPGSDLHTVGEVLSDRDNPGRKQPFDIRSVMRAVIDQDHAPLERWVDLEGGDTVAVWDAHLGGWPVCVVGIEGHAVPRRGIVPPDGPAQWTSGTFFPMSSKKTARAVNAASGSRPLVVLANLSGFDGSPESMRNRQLEFGAEIGRAVVNFRGPIVFCVVSRFHGGAFVVFSKRLNPALETIAVEGAHASVIGGAPAAAVVFAGEVERRTRSDGRVREVHDRMGVAEAGDRARLRTELGAVRAAVRAEKLGEVAEEFDAVHSVERAREVGSVDRIVAAAELRASLIDAIERGIERELARARS